MKYSKRVTTRERVIKRQINDIREYLISIQLEAEYYKECTDEMTKMLEKSKAELERINNSGEAFDAAYKDSVVSLINDAEVNIKAFEDLIKEKEMVEKGLITKLNFYKKKREELTTREFENAIKSTPNKIKVNLNGVDFKEGPNK